MIVFSKRDCPLDWNLVEYTFNHYTYLRRNVRCKRSKPTVNANQDRYNITWRWNNLFWDGQIIRLRQAYSASRLCAKEFTFDKSSSIKQTIYQNLANSNGNTFNFIPHVCYFSRHPSIAASETRTLTTLFSTKMGERKHSHKNINISVFQICSRNNKTSLLLYACDVIYLINKGVISPYVQEQGRILSKFNKYSSSSLSNTLLR